MGQLKHRGRRYNGAERIQQIFPNQARTAHLAEAGREGYCGGKSSLRTFCGNPETTKS